MFRDANLVQDRLWIWIFPFFKKQLVSQGFKISCMFFWGGQWLKCDEAIISRLSFTYTQLKSVLQSPVLTRDCKDHTVAPPDLKGIYSVNGWRRKIWMHILMIKALPYSGPLCGARAQIFYRVSSAETVPQIQQLDARATKKEPFVW